MIKTKHEEKRAKKKGASERVPSYMSQTVASLQKRQSFRHPGVLSRGGLPRRRTQSLDPEMSQKLDREKELRFEGFGPELEMISGESSDGANEEDYVVDAEEEAPVDLEQLRDDVERAYNQTFVDARRLRRNSTGSRRIEGGVSPLPSRSSDGEEVLFEGRPHSAAEVVQRETEFDRGATGSTGELPLPMEVEIERPDDVLQQRPSTVTQSESFDSTAAITESPRARALSPYLENPKPAANRKISRSHLDHTVPQNVREIQDTSADAENSDGSRGSSEVRCQSGAAISGSAPSVGYVQITEEKRREVRRPSDVHDKPNIRGSLILAGIFAGVAIIVGKIFSSKD